MVKRKHINQFMKLQVMARQCLCRICGQGLSIMENVEFDHVQALARGGADTVDNLQAICKSCHKVKSFGKKATTLGSDIHEAAKTKRLERGKRKSKGPPIRSAGFQKGFRKKMNGTVERIEK